ncbi:MAG: Serine/threonine-protein kinase PknD [Anaerolineales bacterium]|nr:Serine/threonine-protein kinase PknD [Anaerolineales bacterium]
MSPDKVGRYKIKSELGRGGMATVYRAHDPSFNREVAIKVLPREMLHNLLNRSRFKRELKFIASLEHPAIVPVYDVGEDGDQPFFVMRYMSGGSLSDMIKQGPFTLPDAALIIERLAAALDHAHAHKIIHRDIKPDNVLFDGSHNPYLSDFGVAKLTESVVSATGNEVIGTPAYISPEQARGEQVDRRADIYGLGAILYEMLTGERPYNGESVIGIALQHVNEPIPDILKVRPDLPPEVDTIIKTALAKDKNDRYATALDMARALNHAAFGDERTIPASMVLSARPAVSSRNIWMGVGVLALAIVAGMFALRGQIPFLAPASTPTGNLVANPTAVPPTATSLPSPTAVPAVTEVTPTVPPIPGGADQIAFLSGNELYFMNIDGSGLIQIRTDNSPKSNLQWIPGNRLVYISRNCAFMVYGDTKRVERLVCFNIDETLEGFRVSPDGSHVAISIQRTLNIFPFDIEALKTMDTRFNLIAVKENCFYAGPSFRNALWSKDETRLAARIVDTELINSDQIMLMSVDVQNCANVGLTRIDKFPGLNFGFTNKESTKRITSFDWDGGNLFLLNDDVRNDGFGDLYLYDSNTRQDTIINPMDGVCCYRDARWSPDGKYILFAFQRWDSSEVMLYYVPFADIGSGKPLTPIELPAGFFSTRDSLQPALRPAQ